MSGYVSSALSVINPSNWVTTTKKDVQLVNAASRLAVGSLGALSVIDSYQTAKEIKLSKENWQVTKITKATTQFFAGILALKTAVS